MTTESQRETATVYTFPVRGRFATEGRRDGGDRPGGQDDVRIVTGSGWYHDEAIREDQIRTS